MDIKNNDPKKKFIEELMSMSKEDIEEMISSKGKPPKLFRPALIVQK